MKKSDMNLKKPEKQLYYISAISGGVPDSTGEGSGLIACRG